MRDDVAVPDYFELLFFYTELRVRLKATCIAKESGYGYILHGMKGSFLQKRSDMQETALQEGIVPTIDSWAPGPASPDGILHTTIDGATIRESTTSMPGNYMDYYKEVYEALIGTAPNPVTTEQAVLNTMIIEAALQSASSGKIINL
jgi:predicted dehydrogenase